MNSFCGMIRCNKNWLSILDLELKEIYFIKTKKELILIMSLGGSPLVYLCDHS